MRSIKQKERQSRKGAPHGPRQDTPVPFIFDDQNREQRERRITEVGRKCGDQNPAEWFELT